jgi:hypothetical protein
LVNPFLAALYRLDTTATEVASGFDSEFRETKRSSDGTWKGASQRHEQAEIRVRCQIEVNTYGALAALLTGNSTENHIVLCFHFADLERAGLVDATSKDAEIKLHARLTAIYRTNGTLEQTIKGDGLYAVDVQPGSFGLGGRRNLLLVTFKDRNTSAKG